MFLLSLSPLVSNIAHQDSCLRAFASRECSFSLNSQQRAYSPDVRHIKACKSEYVKDCGIWLNSDRPEKKPNGRGNKWQIAILK